MNGAFCIAAADRRGGIGRAGGLPWPRIPGELAWFRERTLGRTVLVGRKTWEGLPRPGGGPPLPGRRVVVLSRGSVPGAETTPDMEGFLRANPGVAVIGGGEVYRMAAGLVDLWLVTRVDAEYECDTFLPPLSDFPVGRGRFEWDVLEAPRGDGPPPWRVEIGRRA